MNRKEIDINSIKNSDYAASKSNDEIFINEHMGLIKSIASKIFQSGKVPSCIEFDDLISWGVEGLLKAKKGFKENLNTKFQTYAYYRIRGEILDSIRNEWTSRMPKEYYEKKVKLQETLADFIDDSISENSGSANDKVDEAVESATFVHYLSSEIQMEISESKGTKDPEIEIIDENYDFLWNEIKDLDYPYKEVIELFYIHGLKQVEIAEHLKLSKSRICRIHSDVLNKLKMRIVQGKFE